MRKREIRLLILATAILLLVLSGWGCSPLFSLRERARYQLRLEVVDKIRPDAPEELYRDFGGFFFEENGSYSYADHIKKQIAVHDREGRLLVRFGGKGADPGYFNAITDIDRLANGHLMVVDAIAQKISEFDTQAKFLGYIAEFDMNAWHPVRNRIVSESKEEADSIRYLTWNENTTFFVSPYCDAQIVDGRYLFLAGHEQGPYYRNDLKNLNLLRKFYWPELSELFQGGKYSRVYRRSIRPLQSYDFACIDNQVYLIEANVPYITRLNEFLDLREVVYHEGSGFRPIPEDFREDVFLEDNLKPLFDYISGCSMMQRIFGHGSYVLTLYKTIGNFENFLKDTYRHHYYNFQEYTERVDFANYAGGEDTQCLQVFSRDLKSFYGDLPLGNRFLGYNGEYLFLAGNPRNPLQKNQLLKCRVVVETRRAGRAHRPE